MRIGSLFAGAGGLDMAVAEVFGGEVVWHSEIDKAASKVLAYRFPGVPNLGDITQVDWADIPPVDVLCGGFPCQDVSAAGKRAGIKQGTRSGLWSVFAEAIDVLRPQLVVIENVRGLLNAQAHRDVECDQGIVGDGSDRPVLRAIGAVLGDLADVGYDAQWATVAAADVGAPHRRERVFILAADAKGTGAGNNVGRLWRLPQQSASAADSSRNGRHEGRPESARQQRGFDAAVGGDEPGVALLPTPVSRDGKDTHSSPRMAEKSKPSGIAHLLPTPEAKNSHAGPDYARMNREGSGGHDLVTAISLLPTPTVGDGTGGGRRTSTRDGRDTHNDSLRDAVNLAQTQWGKYEPAIRRWESLTRPASAPTEPNKNNNPRLSAAFSEWLMGWPAGHVTDPAIGISRNDQLRIVGNGVCPQQAVAALRFLLGVAVAA